jgi:indole-3-glycerol phosphate synthase
MEFMTTYLDNILATTRITVDASRRRVNQSEVESLASKHQPRGWAAALKKRTGQAIIAEIKKASPSKGLIRDLFNVTELAESYFKGGATALSVLTDTPFFQGSLENLRLTSAAVPLPCLRKDFIIDEYQIAEARANAADAILLIAAALTNQEMKRFAQKAHDFSLDVLVEVHTNDELSRVLDALGADGAEAIGVNNRDLVSFEVDIERSLELVERIPRQVVRVTESGIQSSADIVRLRDAGFDAFLIGESFMRQPNPGLALSEILHGAVK